MNAIQKFEKKNMVAFQQLASIADTKKALENQEKEIKEALQKNMQKHGIASIDNDIVRINLIPETETVSIDTKQLRQDDPDLYHDIEKRFNKRVKKKAYIRITVK